MEDILTNVPKTKTFANKISVEEYNQQKDDYTQKALKELSEQMKTFEKPKQTCTKFNIINTSKKINTDIIDIDNNTNINEDDTRDDNSDDNSYNNNGDNGNNNSNDNNDSESDYDTNLDTINKRNSKKTHPSINLIVQHVENKQKKRKLTTTQSKIQDNTTTTMSDSIYAQHEVDMQTIQLLKDKINELKIENANLDSKKHYLTLDLNNAQCEVNDLKKQVSYLKDQLITHKQFIKQMKKYDDDFSKMLKLFLISCFILFIIYFTYLY